jgi:hypothetical protein
VSWRRRVADIAELVVWATLSKPATLGPGRLVCIDGHAGSGKSSLGSAVLDAAVEAGAAARLLHVDDMLEGWTGLAAVAGTIQRDLVGPLAEGHPGSYRHYDWHRGAFTRTHRVDPVDVLVLEGVGSGATAYAGEITTLVWVEAPLGLRMQRGLERDGESLRSHWEMWAAQEDELFARERTRERADVLVDGTGEADRAVTFA